MEALERRELLSVDVSAVGEGSGFGKRSYNTTPALDFYQVNYKVTITSQGDAESVVLTDVLDPRVRGVGVDIPGLERPVDYTETYDQATGVLTVAIPALSGAVEVRINGSVKILPTDASASAPALTNDFSIATGSPNENPQTSGSIPVNAPNPVADASLTHHVDETPIQNGHDVLYTFVATNNSTFATVPQARIVVDLPGEWLRDKTGFSTDRNPGWEEVWDSTTYLDPYTWVAHTDTWLSGFTFEVGDLAPGESETVTLTLRPEHPPGSSPTLAFPAALWTSGYDFDVANNVANIATPFVPEAHVEINGTVASPFPTPVGGNLTYTLNLRGLGPNPATGVIVHQSLPAGATFVSAALGGDPIAGVVDGGMLTIALPDGRLGPLVITLNTAGIAAPAAPTPVSAPIEATWNEDPGSVSGVAAMGSVAPRGYVGSLLEERDASILVHQSQLYSYTLSNADAFATSALTADLTFPPASVMALAPGNYTVEQTPTSQIVTFHLKALAAGETRRLEVASVALSPAPAGFDVVARVVEDGRPETYYPTSSVTTTIVPAVHLVATLSPAEKNERTISVTNEGPNTATGVVIKWSDTPYRYHYGRFEPIPPYVTESVSAGTVEAGQTIVVDVGQYAFDPEYYNGLDARANEPDVISAPWTTETAPYDFASWLGADVASVETGGLATFTARTMSMGPMDAENIQLIAEIPANSRLVSVSPGVVVAGNRLILDIAKLAVGEEVGFWCVVSPTWDALAAGGLTAKAFVSTSRDLGYYDRSQASTTVPVTAGPSGELVPGSPSYEASEDAGAIVITVNRVGGVSGPLTVDYATEAVDAVDGVDFVPVSGTLVFEDGEMSRTITVSVLDNPYSAIDRTARLVLSNGQTALLTIRDVDHDRATPAVADIQWVGPPGGIAAIQVTFARPLADATNLDPSAFALVAAGRGLSYGARMGRLIPMRSTYIPETSTVVLTPRRPLPSNLFYRLTVAGGGLTPGSDHVASLARGRSLDYLASADELVTLRLRGAGYIDALLTGPNQEERLNVVSLGARQASVSKRVVKLHARGSGQVRVQPPSRPPLAWNRLAASTMRRSS